MSNVVTQKPQNLFNKAIVTVGYYVNSTNGNLALTAGFVASDYIPVTAGLVYAFKWIRHFVFYNSSKTYISGDNTNRAATWSIIAPTDAAYVRFSFYVTATRLNYRIEI